MADRPWSVKRATVEQYEIRGPFGAWAIITLDPRGVFQAVSDFGTYAYSGWGHHGRKSFKHFLVGLREADYFVGKVCQDTPGLRGPGRSGHVFDFDKTVRHIQQMIVESRRDDSLTKEQARACWDELSDVDDDGTDDAFVERISHCPTLFAEVFDHDYCDVVDSCCTSISAGPLRFFNEIFRGQLVPALEAELAAETAEVRCG